MVDLDFLVSDIYLNCDLGQGILSKFQLPHLWKRNSNSACIGLWLDWIEKRMWSSWSMRGTQMSFSSLTVQYPYCWRLNSILFHQFVFKSAYMQKKSILNYKGRLELIKHSSFLPVAFCFGERQTYKEVALIKSDSDRHSVQYKECYALI